MTRGGVLIVNRLPYMYDTRRKRTFKNDKESIRLVQYYSSAKLEYLEVLRIRCFDPSYCSCDKINKNWLSQESVSTLNFLCEKIGRKTTAALWIYSRGSIRSSFLLNWTTITSLFSILGSAERGRYSVEVILEVTEYV